MASLKDIKLASYIWDSDKSPHGFAKFMDNWSSIVSSVQGGDELERFLDGKLERARSSKALVPSFIANDPDFDEPGSSSTARNTMAAGIPTVGATAPQPANATPNMDTTQATTDLPDEDGDGDNASKASAPSMTTGQTHGANFRLKAAHVTYSALPVASRQLDRQLYSMLKVSVKGSKHHLLRNVSFPSYVQGMCILHSHCQLSHNQRKTAAFTAMEQLKFKTDVHDWEVETISSIQELLDSGCTIMDYALSCVLKSLQGKSKTIQYRIADDINHRDTNDSERNVFDMIHSYAASMASVGDHGLGKDRAKIYTAESNAEIESTTGNETATDSHNKKNGKNKSKINKECTYCQSKGWSGIGHTEDECRTKKRDERNNKSKSEEPSTSKSAANIASATGEHMTERQATIANLIEALERGRASVNTARAQVSKPEAAISAKRQ